ncbi:Fe-S cluster assembly protein HesB [Streptomyces sp. BH-SS-21]|uniref:Fe-S cluster assembly protein HesB n=1 Tax=Streptomyces liliiviolaceus TaxID=2823109 RepID=A0A940XRM8_9ACTN|nr:HhH-GPD-type base excision DNA repair protein [Streptomyces liliiviolaceus]MBQ0847668.1 Fe-S cluster assembly protein HesB [Streptomyces liliiviolaceus]
MDVTLHLAQQPEADELLGRSPLAALVGMLLDQQVPMEWAFAGPYTIARRLDADDLDAHEIAAYEPEAFAALLSTKPAVHRYPGSMAKRIQQLCQYLVEHYDGDAAKVWEGADPGTGAGAVTGAELLRRLKELPGFGTQKAQIFLALLGKQLGVRPKGWREAAGPYGEARSFRSVADITGPESLTKVRAHKQEMKAAAKAAAETTAKSATAAKTAKTAKATKAGKAAKAVKGSGG